MKDYFAGQRLRGELGVLEQAKWIKTTTAHSAAAAKKHPDKRITVTVQKVKVTNANDLNCLNRLLSHQIRNTSWVPYRSVLRKLLQFFV